MIEYYLKFNQKNIKPLVSDLIKEVESFFKLENIEIMESSKSYFSNLESFIEKKQVKKVNDIYFTIDNYKDRFPFLQNYINKNQKNTEKQFRFADTFAGCGGLSLGLQNAGFNLSFVNEINATYCETFYFNHDLSLDHYFVGDIHTLNNDLSPFSEALTNLDLVTGGAPCQGFSMANRQRVIDDPRNHLYKAYLEFLSLTRPKFFLLENVKGMTNKIKEILEDFNTYLGDYDIHFGLFNAKDFGIPQNRERFFIIGNRIGVETKTIFEAIKKEQKAGFVLIDALQDLPKLKSKNIKNDNSIENADYGFTMRINTEGVTNYSKYINNERSQRYVFNHKNRYNNERDIEIFDRLPQGANSLHPSIKDIMPYTSRNHMFKDKYFKLDETQPCKTITSHMKFDCNMYIHPMQARGLSSREAARIQTFPDDFYIRGSQNNWFAQIGNAVPVKLAEIIGKHIIEKLK